MNRKLRWFLLFLTVVLLIFASEMNKIQNYEAVPLAQLHYTDEAGEDAMEKELLLVGTYWKEENSEKNAAYKGGSRPLLSERAGDSDGNRYEEGIRLSEEDSVVDLVYTLIPSEKAYQYSIVRAWTLAEIESALAGSDVVMEEDVSGEMVSFTEIPNGIRLTAQSGCLYRVTSFWGDDGEYTTHEFIAK